MMGRHEPPKDSLFIYNLYLEDRVRKDHPLRKVTAAIDFDFIYGEVKDTYGTKGNISVPPPVILKLMFLLIFYNVRSERELMETIPERLDWLWFLGYTLDSPIPDHSVLSKARTRWGQEAFQRFFETIVTQCVRAGLVDGTTLFMDASLIEAHASNASVVQSLKPYLAQGYRTLEERLTGDDDGVPRSRSDVNKRYRSTTDPDAAIVRQGGTPRLYYKTHRAVDPAHEIVTALTVTPGCANEAHRMADLIADHEKQTNQTVRTVVADSKYGTIDNLLFCHDRAITPHIPVLKKSHEGKGSKKDIFPETDFTYDQETDTMICPAGAILRKRTFHVDRQSTEYIGSRKVCAACSRKSQCTKNALGRTVHRHIRKDAIDAMTALTSTTRAKRDIRLRQTLMERSFARGTRYGFDEARWRGLWKVSIQEYLTAAIQNIQVLIRHVHTPTRGVLALTLRALMQRTAGALRTMHALLSRCLPVWTGTCTCGTILFVVSRWTPRGSLWA